MTARLSNWEWTLLWSSLDTFIDLGEEDCEYWIQFFIKNDEERLTMDQRFVLQATVQHWLESSELLNTKHLWGKLLSYLDPGNRYLVTTDVDGKLSKQTCFMHNYSWAPVEKYKADITAEWMVIPDLIEDIQQTSALN